MVSLVGQSIASATHLAGKTEGNTVFISKDQKHQKDIIQKIQKALLESSDQGGSSTMMLT